MILFAVAVRICVRDPLRRVIRTRVVGADVRLEATRRLQAQIHAEGLLPASFRVVISEVKESQAPALARVGAEVEVVEVSGRLDDGRTATRIEIVETSVRPTS